MTTTPSMTGSRAVCRVQRRVYSLWAACLLTGCCLAVLALSGCSGGSTAIGTSTTTTDPARTTVPTFLEAIKRGDDAGARAMLTKVARAKTEELGLSVAPPVTSSATYSIREVEHIAGAEDLVGSPPLKMSSGPSASIPRAGGWRAWPRGFLTICRRCC